MIAPHTTLLVKLLDLVEDKLDFRDSRWRHRSSKAHGSQSYRGLLYVSRLLEAVSGLSAT